MATIPASPLNLGDNGYQTIYDMWVAQGRPSFLENQAAGWLRQAIFPNAGVSPTFVLVCSAAGTTTANRTSGITGYGRAMSTKQRTHAPRGKLPKEAV